MAEQNQPGEMTKSSPGQAGGQVEFWQETAAMSMAEADADKQSMKVAWLGALIFHFLLFITVFPSMGGMAFEAEEREAVVINRYKPPTPPKEQPKQKVVKKTASRVSIPTQHQMNPSRLSLKRSSTSRTRKSRSTQIS